MKCTIQIEDDNNTVIKNVSDSEGNFDGGYCREDMLRCFFTALLGMGYSLNGYDAEELATEVDNMIVRHGRAKT